jgi:SAM-dependent methyltransferase
MRPEELPGIVQALGPEKGRVDPVLALYDSVLQSGYLHFGYWPEGQPQPDLNQLMSNVRGAQRRYVDELLSLFPTGMKTVLDVGAGMGKLAGELSERGYTVSAVTPDHYQVTTIRERYPKVTVHEGRFQDIGAGLAAGYDLILFSESFRYMPLEESFRLFDRLLSRQGAIVIADWFTRDGQTGSRHGHDHPMARFHEIVKGSPFRVRVERDITANILPMVKLADEILCNLYLPLVVFPLAKFAQKWPRLFRFTKNRLIRWYTKKGLPSLTARGDAAAFSKRYQYMFCVLTRA